MSAEMTKRERLLAAIHHQEPDRVPVAPRAQNFYQEYYGCTCWLHELRASREFDFDPFIILEPYGHTNHPSLRRSYTNVKNYVRGWADTYQDLLEGVSVDLHIERYPEYTSVRRKIHTPAGTLSDEMRQYKPDIGYGTWPSPHFVERMIKGREDLEKIPYILPDPMKAHLKDVPEIMEIVGKDGLVTVFVPSPVDVRLGDAMGLEGLMLLYYDDENLFLELLRLFQEYTLGQIRACLEAGTEIIYGTWHYAGLSAGWSPRIIREMFMPLVKEQVDLTHSYDAIYYYYDDGKLMGLLDMVKECGVDALTTLCPPPVGDFDLAEAKQRIGDAVCLHGYMDLIYVIKMGTPEQIRETVREAILTAAPGGGFILGTSDSIREAPLENVRAYFEAGRTYGDYRHLGREA